MYCAPFFLNGRGGNVTVPITYLLLRPYICVRIPFAELEGTPTEPQVI